MAKSPFALNYIEKSERLNYLAYHDALTGLPNRTLLQERLAAAVNGARHSGSKLALVYCDIKRFRHVNEILGREGGDALLREVAERLRRLWPEPSGVGRVAADCFAGVLLNVRDAADIAHLREGTIRESLGKPFVLGDRELRVAMTSGIAIFPSDGGDADTLLRNAEVAAKKAKAAAEKYLFYHPRMNATVAETLLLETRLRRAIERERFTLHYQPVVDISNGNTSGLEALIRWNDLESGLVAPARFNAVLEETGLIIDVSQWAIGRAINDYCEWMTQGVHPPRIAVNVSSMQLRQKDLANTVRRAVVALDRQAVELEFEITESMLMEDIEDNIMKLVALKDMGISIAIDDFGTGYSSLSYLSRLPVSTLKNDRSFVVTMTRNPESMLIVQTITSLAHSLNLKVIAEGVNSKKQLEFLRLFKCDDVQGYLFSRPLPADAVLQFLSTHGPSNDGTGAPRPS